MGFPHESSRWAAMVAEIAIVGDQNVDAACLFSCRPRVGNGKSQGLSQGFMSHLRD